MPSCTCRRGDSNSCCTHSTVAWASSHWTRLSPSCGTLSAHRLRPRELRECLSVGFVTFHHAVHDLQILISLHAKGFATCCVSCSRNLIGHGSYHLFDCDLVPLTNGDQPKRVLGHPTPSCDSLTSGSPCYSGLDSSCSCLWRELQAPHLRLWDECDDLWFLNLCCSIQL